MARITVEDCIDKFESRFELVLVAANRARKIHSGESPTVEKDNDKNTVIALREIADETIPVENLKEKLVEEYQVVSMHNEDDMSLESSDYEDIDNEDENKVLNNIEDNIENNDIDQKEKTSSLSADQNIIVENHEESTVDNLSQNIEEEKN